MALLVALAPLLVAVALIALIERYAPMLAGRLSVPTGQSWKARVEIGPDEFEDVVKELLQVLGLEIVFSSVGPGGTLDLTCGDPRPVLGERIFVRASAAVGAGQVGAEQVLQFADTSWEQMGVRRGIYIAAAGFTDEARAALRSRLARVELVDACRLVELLRAHLPERAERIAGDPAFRAGARGRIGASGASGSEDPGPAPGMPTPPGLTR